MIGAMKQLARTVVLVPFQKLAPLRRLAGFIAANTGGRSYEFLKRQFVENGRGSRYDSSVRAEMLRRFETVDRRVPIASSKTDALFLAEALLALPAEGDIVECGCFCGGSTAKLSIVAKAVGRRLHVFDSFEGLPEVGDYDLRDFHARRSSQWVTDWTQGRYAARLEFVQSNVERYGEIGSCRFTKGWFADTLTPENLPEKIALAFTDVDIPKSARECIRAVWPRLAVGGMYFSHDVAYVKVLQSLLDEELWRKELGEFPPILFGAGYGLSDSSPHLGFMVKQAPSAEYIKALTMEK